MPMLAEIETDEIVLFEDEKYHFRRLSMPTNSFWVSWLVLILLSLALFAAQSHPLVHALAIFNIAFGIARIGAAFGWTRGYYLITVDESAHFLIVRCKKSKHVNRQGEVNHSAFIDLEKIKAPDIEVRMTYALLHLEAKYGNDYVIELPSYEVAKEVHKAVSTIIKSNERPDETKRHRYRQLERFNSEMSCVETRPKR